MQCEQDDAYSVSSRSVLNPPGPSKLNMNCLDPSSPSRGVPKKVPPVNRGPPIGPFERVNGVNHGTILLFILKHRIQKRRSNA